MKILHIIYDDVKNPWVGGGGSIRAYEINRLLAEKHSITVITGKFPGSENEVKEGVTYKRIGIGHNYLFSRLFFTLLAPFYILKSNFDILINDFSIFSPVFGYWLTKKPAVNTFYHLIGGQSLKKFRFFGIIPMMFEKLFLMTADNIITISPTVTNDITKKHKYRFIECIYTGFDESLLAVEPKKGKYISFIGRLDVYMKGIDVLIESMGKISDKAVKLKIAGTGPQKNIDKILELIEKFNLKSNIDLEGRISDEEKKTFLSECYFLVMPSRFEGWGISAVEAAACGKAVIGTKISGLSDAVVDGKTGILVDPDDPETLAKAIDKLLLDNILREEMGSSGKEWAGNFRWKKIAEKQENFYRRIVDNK
ncbi:glycosyltransferase family 4 protein [candidate division KSB1 bacterium]